MKQIENVLTLLGAAEREVSLIAKMVRGATKSYDRLGDFIVARNAIARLSSHLEFLITAENGSMAEPDDIAVPLDSPRGQEIMRRELLDRAERERFTPQLQEKTAVPSSVLPASNIPAKKKGRPPVAHSEFKDFEDAQKSGLAAGLATGHGSVAALILELLAFEPRTPSELHQAINRKRAGTPIGSVYTATSVLKTEGKIESRQDDEGTRKWFLLKKK